MENKIIFEEKEFNLETHIFYEGPKEELIPEINTVLLWYDILENEEGQFGEVWFVIKASKENFDKYVNQEICLLSLMKISAVSLTNRLFSDYDNLSSFTEIEDLESCELPSEGVFF